MNPDNLLSQLRDAHAPEPIGLWPMAPGWWIVIILGLITLTSLVYFGLRFWRANIWRREAKSEFRLIRDRYLQEPSDAHLIALNQLLKRILCTARGTRKYMHFVEQDWARELSSIKLKDSPVLHEEEVHLLSYDLYSAQQNHLDSDALRRLEQWINKVS